ncbi:U5 small nuclear ribonucleoprotein 40 kDa-like protein, partial [Trifolium pratense]
ALDGVVNFWQVQSRGSGASLLNSSDSASQKKRWPEDIAWHPEGNRLFSVYTADSGDSQVSITDLNKQGGARVKYLEDKPHFKGIINGIVFMPWEDTCFVTGGSDHAVILWSEQDGENKWKPKPLHRNLHSSAVMGVAGMQQKQIVLSAGADRRIFGFDVGVGRADFSHQIDSKCMSVVPNPRDFNLFMVQTGTHEKQLRLFDIRLRRTELHAFGWKQESSESQSALINQAWSPDGLYITSGSADPVIHIFDIRYNVNRPSQSIRAHQKRVFGALWLQSLPLLISISSDLNIGLHTLQK